jgi:hypothetical protein
VTSLTVKIPNCMGFSLVASDLCVCMNHNNMMVTESIPDGQFPAPNAGI